MRLIDVDKLLETLQDLEPHCDNKQYENGMLKMLRYYMPQIINDEPTAYSVDKVVEELNQRKIKLLSYAEDYEKTGDFEQAEIYSQLAIEYTTAIEIVKHGGMGKDVE